jgi:response regulator of citrate/malate metabolism
MVWYTLEQCVSLYDTYVKYGSARKCRQKINQRKFHNEKVPSGQTIHNLLNKLRSTGLFDKKQKHELRVLTEGQLDDIAARLAHTPTISLKLLAQETGVSKSSARRTIQLLKLRPYTNNSNPRHAAA